MFNVLNTRWRMLDYRVRSAFMAAILDLPCNIWIGTRQVRRLWMCHLETLALWPLAVSLFSLIIRQLILIIISAWIGRATYQKTWTLHVVMIMTGIISHVLVRVSFFFLLHDILLVSLHALQELTSRKKEKKITHMDKIVCYPVNDWKKPQWSMK